MVSLKLERVWYGTSIVLYGSCIVWYAYFRVVWKCFGTWVRINGMILCFPYFIGCESSTSWSVVQGLCFVVIYFATKTRGRIFIEERNTTIKKLSDLIFKVELNFINVMLMKISKLPVIFQYNPSLRKHIATSVNSKARLTRQTREITSLLHLYSVL
jgi:hypothetical protein